MLCVRATVSKQSKPNKDVLNGQPEKVINTCLDT